MNAEVVQGNVPKAPVKAGWILLSVAWLCFVLPLPGIGMFVGWPLNLAAFVVAIVVMTRGRTGPGVMQLLASLIVSPIVYAIGLAILGAVAIGASGEAPSASNDVEPTASDAADSHANAQGISARELFNEYEGNEVAADQQFKGKPLRVDGTVAGISKDAFDGIYVELRTGNEFMSVRATGIPEASAASLSKGDQVTLLCIGGGMLIGSPILEKCAIAE